MLPDNTKLGSAHESTLFPLFYISLFLVAHPGRHLGERIEKNRGKGHRHRYEGKVKRISVDSSYTVEDQLEQVGDTLYAYNEDGYLSSKVAPEGTTHYTYGSLGELKSVVLPDSTTIEYLHNANNQRVAKKVDGVVTEKYLWADLTTLLAVYDGSDNLKIRFEYADGRMPYKMSYEGQSYYLAYDQVGTLRAVADSNGNVVKALTYDTFGNLFSDSNPDMEVPFGFAGGIYDRDTGLVRFGYRDYDPVTGKWTAKDPIGFNGGDTNLYGHVLGDPVNLVDPEGLEPLLDKLQKMFWGDTGKGLAKKDFCIACETMGSKGCDLVATQLYNGCAGDDTGCRLEVSELYKKCLQDKLKCEE